MGIPKDAAVWIVLLGARLIELQVICDRFIVGMQLAYQFDDRQIFAAADRALPK